MRSLHQIFLNAERRLGVYSIRSLNSECRYFKQNLFFFLAGLHDTCPEGVDSTINTPASTSKTLEVSSRFWHAHQRCVWTCVCPHLFLHHLSPLNPLPKGNGKILVHRDVLFRKIFSKSCHKFDQGEKHSILIYCDQVILCFAKTRIFNWLFRVQHFCPRRWRPCKCQCSWVQDL